MEKPLISVLMVTYNRAEFLKASIESVLNQTYKNLQFIIVDDGSTDESCQIIEDFHDDRIELYCLKENRHICYATNYGFTKIKGEYLARIDSDEVWYSNKLTEQLAFMENHKDCKICFSSVDIIDRYGNNVNDKEQQLMKLYETQLQSQEEYLHYFFLKGNCLAQTSVLMKTEILQKIGEFNPSYVQLHDFDYWVRVAKHYKIYSINKHLLAVRRFTAEDHMENNSSPLNDMNIIRFHNEYCDIRRHFFDDLADELFVKTFQSSFRKKDAISKEELECEKAFLLCIPIPNSITVSAVGIERLFALMVRPQIRKTLEENYQFKEKDMYELTGLSVYRDCIVEDTLYKKDADIENLKQQVEEVYRLNYEKEQQIELYRGSLSWKITEPLRKIARMVRRR